MAAKRIEGCSERTVSYYKVTIMSMLFAIELPVIRMTIEDVRQYLMEYQARRNCGKVTLDNIRRNLSSFFSWLEEEDYIIKSPIRRIHKVKTGTTVKEIISDENIEIMRDGCDTKRDLAMLDILYSTGMRVGELVNLDISEIDFQERECIVYGKGDNIDHIFIENHISESEIELIDFEMLLTQYCFEIYDAEEFMNDICTSNDSVEEILSAIRRSDGKSFCINIIVKQTVGVNHIMNLVALMKSWVRGNKS